MDENEWKYHGEGNKSLVVSHVQVRRRSRHTSRAKAGAEFKRRTGTPTARATLYVNSGGRWDTFKLKVFTSTVRVLRSYPRSLAGSLATDELRVKTKKKKRRKMVTESTTTDKTTAARHNSHAHIHVRSTLPTDRVTSWAVKCNRRS